MTSESQVDQTDRRIINALMVDGRMAVTDLAKKIGMSKTPCSVRLKRMIEDGVILGFKAIVNPAKLGMSHVAFVEIRLDNTKEAALTEFNHAIQAIPEIEECHMIAGPFDYLLKVRSKDILAYRRVLGEKISTLPHVTNSSTYVAMESVKEQGR